MTAETDQILHTIKRMVRQSLHDMEMDKERFATERMEMQAEINEIAKKTKYYPLIAIIISFISFVGIVFGALIAAKF